MKFSFLGTSHGVPAADRFTSCYLLEVGQNLYIFDAGAPVTNLLLQRGADMKQVKAFFCSHFHGDHIDGGVTMLNLFDWYYKSGGKNAQNLRKRLRRRLLYRRQSPLPCDPAGGHF